MIKQVVSTSDVFGVSASVNSFSYVDRANLDKKLKRLLTREGHIAIKGPSKCGKSWLRQRCLDNPIIVQCRLDMTPETIYRQALNSIGVLFDIQRSTATTFSGNASANGKVKMPFVAEAELGFDMSGSRESSVGTDIDYSCSISNLEFVANSINDSGRRLVIEDFHYLSPKTREKLAYDLKTLWDYKCFIIVIGVWTQSNLLTYLNPDLTARIEEITISWSELELRQVIEKGSSALNIEIDSSIQDDIIKDSFGNVGILQKLLLLLVEDEADISKSCTVQMSIVNPNLYFQAAKAYAGQLDGLYQNFAKSLSSGIRQRKQSTGIYALAMQSIVEASDEQLINGYSRADIYEKTHSQENRIQKGNLKIVLRKLVELQELSQHSLVISYDESNDAVFAIDLQLLFYRKHHSMKWPWEEMAEEARQQSLFDTEED